MKPIEKKHYATTAVQPRLSEFCQAFLNYVKTKNLDLLEIKNEYSRFDGLITSANTETSIQIPAEYKGWKYKGISEYQNAFIEKQKYENLKTANELIDSPFSLFIIEYQDCVMVWKFDGHEKLVGDVLPTPIANGSKTIEITPIYYLEYDSAHLIVAKRTRRISRVDELQHYIDLKKTGKYDVRNYLTKN